MGVVVIHAGMGKAGSSSIQWWLARNAAELKQSGVSVVVARADGRGGEANSLELTEYRSGNAASNSFVLAYSAAGQRRPALLESFCEQLESAATRNRIVVISSEGMETLFQRSDGGGFVERLEKLARHLQVRVAYYVRPQHTALEAAWREWGFRSGQSPSVYLSSRSALLNYFEIYNTVRAHAPSVSFEPRPFRADLLDLGDPVADFARRFLELADWPAGETSPWSNRGLPLEVVNALRFAPAGLFWRSVIDNRRLNVIKAALGDLEARETEETNRSRLLLQAYCHQAFEQGNRRLIEARGWEAAGFVPAVESDDVGPERRLTALDELWRPKSSEAELSALYTALERILAEEQASRERQRSLAKTGRLLAATFHEVAAAQAELEALSAKRYWRMSRRLAKARSAITGRKAVDPTSAVAKRLAGAMSRVERSMPRVDPQADGPYTRRLSPPDREQRSSPPPQPLELELEGEITEEHRERPRGEEAWVQ